MVTGGARRLGKEISIGLAESGFDVIVNYNESSKAAVEETLNQVRAAGSDGTAIKCDVSRVAEIKKMFKSVLNRYGKLDLLVNNAGIFRHKDFLETDEKFFDKFINTNLKSVFFCSQEAAKIMLKNRESTGRIINIASMGAVENWTGYIPYSVSKAGVVKLTKLLAKRLAPGIIVNAIAPGTILIDNDENENVNTENVNRYPMKRFGIAQDITSLVNYLAVENRFITGQTFAVDGGKSL